MLPMHLVELEDIDFHTMRLLARLHFFFTTFISCSQECSYTVAESDLVYFAFLV